MIRRFVSTGILLALVFPFISRPGLSVSQQKDQALQNEVIVRFKLIQIYVTDKKGNPVADLKPEEFEITDNGVPKQVGHFEIHSLEVPEGKKPGPEKSAVPAEKIPSQIESVKRKFFLFFDTAFNESRGIKKAQEAALHFIDTQARPEDEVGVISYSALKGLTVHEYLTQDRDKIRDVIQKIGLKAALGRAEALDGIAFRDIEEETETEENFASEFTRNNYVQQAMDFLNDLKSMAKALGHIPGCKNIVLFSNGISGFVLTGARFVNQPENLTSAADLAAYGKAAEVSAGFPGVREAYASVLVELKAANCPMYSVDVSKPRFSNDGFEQLAPDFSTSSQRDLWGTDSLKQLSAGTGGKYFSNASNIRSVMQEIQKITGTYYVLGFPVEETWDGQYHRVSVSVKRKGCAVYGESGYFNPKPFSEYSEFEKQIHLIDLALGKNPYFQESLVISLAAFPIPIGGRTAGGLLAEISKKELVKLAGGKIEAVTLVFNSQGRIAFSSRDDFNPGGLQAENIFQVLTAPLLPGKYECRVVFRDLETGKGARAFCAFQVQDENRAQAVRIYPPLLLLEGKNTLFLGKSEAVFTRFPYVFDSASLRPAIKTCPAGTEKLTIIVPCSSGSIQEPDIRLSASLVQMASGKNIPCSAAVLSRDNRESLHVFMTEIQLAPLQPGEYSLYVFVDETKTGTRSRAAEVFHVE